LDVSNPARLFVQFKSVRVGDRDVDPLKVEKIIDVFVAAVTHDGENAKVVAIVERLRKLHGKANEGSFEKATGNAHCPAVDLSGFGLLPDRCGRGWRARDGLGRRELGLSHSRAGVDEDRQGE